jgi:hypothetical protein
MKQQFIFLIDEYKENILNVAGIEKKKSTD